jgi:uncharacterized protein (DUF427 family)
MDAARLAALRAGWHWTGAQRPPWAETPGAGQRSVWDFPRPPAIEADAREVVVRWGTDEVVRTRRALRVCETGHPPTWYLPWGDTRRTLLEAAGGGSFCEWKGPARTWDLVDGARRLAGIAWSYPQPLPGAEALADCVAFYARGLAITVDGAPVQPQPGGFYGGWITPDLAGPFKGGPGSAGW